MSTLQEFKTPAEVTSFLDQLHPTTLGIVCFYTTWARQCEPIKQLLGALASQVAPAEPPRAAFLWVEAEAMPAVSKQYGVRSVPWTVLLRGGRTVGTVHGGRADEVRAAVEGALKERDEDVRRQARQAEIPPKLEVHPRELPPGVGAATSQPPSAAAAATVPPPKADAAASTNGAAAGATPAKNFSAYAPTATDPATAPQMTADALAPGADGKTAQERLDERLAGLVKAAPVMLFMKGTPSAPQCGFSRQLVGVLRENGVKYGFFNILADEDVRQGLKAWADWPTYPQLWMAGELVGGIDIVKEEIEKDADFFKEYSVGKGQGGMAAPEAQKQPEATVGA